MTAKAVALPEFPLMKIMVFYHAGFGRSLSAYSHWTRRNYFLCYPESRVINSRDGVAPVTGITSVSGGVGTKKFQLKFIITKLLRTAITIRQKFQDKTLTEVH